MCLNQMYDEDQAEEKRPVDTVRSKPQEIPKPAPTPEPQVTPV
ncbi:MAG: hypothetical protein JWP13_98 [Candidatus Saccharibacteria bacterium]|nr:hypothetical protein [Candidatus Saccharibacteria bacterium]